MVIICVDDDKEELKTVSDAVKELLPQEKVHEFLNSSEAISFSETTAPDVAFLDVKMPDMTGLELAKKLKSVNPEMNIIFATGHTEYTLDAIRLRASGYLIKPITKSDVKKEFGNLRFKVKEGDGKKVEIKTFGRFEIFVNGKPIEFARKPAKEVLAYLVDLHGAVADTKDIFAVLFEDSPYTSSMRSYLSTILKVMTDSLKNAGIERILIKNGNGYSVNINEFYCDAYEYLKGNTEVLDKFYGEYMTQYSWSEDSIMKFYK